MGQLIETDYIVRTGKTAADLTDVLGLLSKQDTAIRRLEGLDPYRGLNQSAQNYHSVLVGGVKVYQQLDGSAKAYREEMGRLNAIERDLIKTQANFADSMEWDEAERGLQAVRRRMEELRQASRLTAEETEKVKKSTGGFMGTVGEFLKSGVGAVAGFFAVDRLINVEQEIIEITGNYEKYFNVLRNGFQSEQKAATSMETLARLAVQTPYALDQLTESYVKYVNRGLVPTEAEIIKLGDLASSQGKSFDQLTEAVLDAVTGEYERLKEFGIRAKTIGDNVTLAFKGTEIQVKKTDQEAIRQAIISFGALTGVAGTMGSQMKSVNGFISNMKDGWEQFLKNLGEKQSGPLYEVIRLTGGIVDKLRQWTSTPIETKIRTEQAELVGLVRQLKLAGDNTQLRNSVMTELSQKYPSFIALIDKEGKSQEGVARALGLVNHEYETKLRLAGLDVLNQRNAEKQADLLERQRKSLQGISQLMRSAGVTEQQFVGMTEAQQRQVLNRGLEKLKKDQNLNEDSLDPFARLNAQKQTAPAKQAITDYFNIQKEQAALDKENLANAAAINAAKERESQAETELLNKAKERVRVLEAKKRLTDDEKRDLEAARNYVSSAPQRGNLQPPKTDQPKPPVDNSSALQDRANERRQLVMQEQQFEERLNQIRLEGDNVRLQLLDRNSTAYLDKKKAYDLAQLEQERQQQIKLYAESQSEVIGKKGKDGKMTYERQTLMQGFVTQRLGKGQSIDEAASGSMADAEKLYNSALPTAPLRALLAAKRALLNQNDRLDREALQATFNGAFLDLEAEGFDKQKQLIETKYAALYKTYKENGELISRLQLAQLKETEEARQSFAQTALEKAAEQREREIQQTQKQQGEDPVLFEADKNAKIAAVRVDFYQQSINALETYLNSEVFLQLRAAGLITDGQKKAYDDQLKNLRTLLGLSEKEQKQSTDRAKSGFRKYADLFDVLGDAYAGITGKQSDFFTKDDEKNKLLRESTEQTVSAIKDSLSAWVDMEARASAERVAVLENEVQQKTAQLAEENNKRRQGLANNYSAVKADLDRTKKARDDEKEQQKKIQKEKAAIDVLTIASTNAVTIATMIQNYAQVMKGATVIPIAGVAIGLALVATLVASFIGIKAKLSAAQTLRKGRRLAGPSHENGGMDVVDPKTGDTLYNVEGKEWLIGTDPSERHDEFLGHLNRDTFKDLPADRQRRLLAPLGLKRETGLAEQSAVTRRALETIGYARHHDTGWQQLSEDMRSIGRHVARIPDRQMVSYAPGKVGIYAPDGDFIGIEEFALPKNE